MQVILAGVGSGTIDTLSVECAQMLQKADLIIGAERMLRQLPDGCTENRLALIKSESILEVILKKKPDFCCVLFSGDSGFYSGARKLLPLLEQEGVSVRILPGFSSVQMLSAKLGVPWQDWNLVSAHGVNCNPLAAVMQGKPAFFLTGGAIGPAEICKQLTEAGLGKLKAVVGEYLFCEEERILHGTAKSFAKEKFQSLAVLLVEPAPKCSYGDPVLPDEAFLRGNVPMTKREVRAAILSKLMIQPEDVVWDIGAGTGSVSIALASVAKKGLVYGIENNAEACALIRKNRERLCAWNLTLIEGKAPEGLQELPTPQAVFIGGTKGEMDGILKTVLEKNPKARICISAIALETLISAVETLKKYGLAPVVTQISVSKTREIGSLHLLMANNPVFLITGGCHD